jgi:hypothetical protein
MIVGVKRWKVWQGQPSPKMPWSPREYRVQFERNLDSLGRIAPKSVHVSLNSSDMTGSIIGSTAYR